MKQARIIHWATVKTKKKREQAPRKKIKATTNEPCQIESEYNIKIKTNEYVHDQLTVILKN
jgi:hypothetical protein